jgi:hypothetical protein
MSVVRILGYSTLSCGCVTGKYRELATRREVTYIEEKGKTCPNATHRRNQVLPRASLSSSPRAESIAS